MNEHPDLKVLVQETPQIATLPSVYSELSTLITQHRANATLVARVVSLDPGLTVRLLRMVNSSFYGLDRRVDTVSHAVSLIGHEQLRQLALATTVVHMFRAMPEHLINMKSYWSHSIATAIACRSLGRMRRVDNVESLFVTGLLHAVGSLVICINRPRKARRVFIQAKNSEKELHEVEEDARYTHADVGAALMKNWGLSANQVEAVRYKHAPMNAQTAYRKEAAILHVASVVACALNVGSVGNEVIPTFSAEAWEDLGLGTEATQALAGTEEQYEDLTKRMTDGV